MFIGFTGSLNKYRDDCVSFLTTVNNNSTPNWSRYILWVQEFIYTKLLHSIKVHEKAFAIDSKHVKFMLSLWTI